MTKVKVRQMRVGGVPLLEPGEEFITVERPSRMLVIPKYLLTLGLYGIWRKRHVSAVTNQRLLLGQGIFRRDERSIPLRRIQDVSFSRRGLSSYSDVVVGHRRGAELVRIGPLSASRARNITAKIEKHLM